MQKNRGEYVSPLVQRYAPAAMRRNFSDLTRFRTWRKLWIALAENQKKLGLRITGEQIKQLKKFEDKINFDLAEEFENELRHDVMAHIRAYGHQCPEAAGIIHLGATSCFVTDNTDVILMHKAAGQIKTQILSVIRALADFARGHAGLVTLAYTHLQPAQPVTVGKRATLWLQDLLIDLKHLDFALGQLKFRGVKGATGSQASVMELFDGDEEKVRRLDKLVAAEFGFGETAAVTGQTYPRKADFYLLSVLSGIAQSAEKFATDVRILSNFRELEEPHGKAQVGSSAMPHKANPVRCERICALARYVVSASANTAHTAAQQWLERSLDDSANRRIVIPEAFMAVSAILNIYLNVAKGLVVRRDVIRRRLYEQLPLLASEPILMEAVRLGGDRQALHERLRVHAAAAKEKDGLEAGAQFLSLVKGDPAFERVRDKLDVLADPGRLAGRCKSQVAEFLDAHVKSVLAGSGDDDAVSEDLKV